MFRCETSDTAHILLGEHNGIDQWHVNVWEHSPGSLALTSLHELHHHGLQTGTSWGAVAMFFIGRADGREWKIERRNIGKACRTVHESYATYGSVEMLPNGLDILSRNPAYISYWETAQTIRESLLGGMDKEGMAPLEILYDLIMAPAALARALDGRSTLTLKEIWLLLVRDTPDDRLRNINALLYENGAAAELLRNSFEESCSALRLGDEFEAYEIARHALGRSGVQCLNNQESHDIAVEFARIHRPDRRLYSWSAANEFLPGAFRNPKSPKAMSSKDRTFLILSERQLFSLRSTRRRLLVKQPHELVTAKSSEDVCGSLVVLGPEVIGKQFICDPKEPLLWGLLRLTGDDVSLRTMTPNDALDLQCGSGEGAEGYLVTTLETVTNWDVPASRLSAGRSVVLIDQPLYATVSRAVRAGLSDYAVVDLGDEFLLSLLAFRTSSLPEAVFVATADEATIHLAEAFMISENVPEMSRACSDSLAGSVLPPLLELIKSFQIIGDVYRP